MVLDVSGSMAYDSDVLCETYYNCSKHNKKGYHKTTRIDELKKAANSFIDKMKDIHNLKIGIVKYSDGAIIEKRNINGKNTALIPANNAEELKRIIDGLSANEGTNTGEGLRKATYLLDSSEEQERSALKSVVLMSDGIPTYRTVYQGTNKFYVDMVTENTGKCDGVGDEDDNGKNTEYVVEIGKIIKSKNYNAFTIGYGMDYNKMRQIHSAMTSKNMADTTTTDQDKGFFFNK